MQLPCIFSFFFLSPRLSAVLPAPADAPPRVLPPPPPPAIGPMPGAAAAVAAVAALAAHKKIAALVKMSKDDRIRVCNVLARANEMLWVSGLVQIKDTTVLLGMVGVLYFMFPHF